MKAAHGSPPLASPSRHHSNTSYGRMKSGLKSKSADHKMGIPQFLRLDSTGEVTSHERPVNNHSVSVSPVGHQNSNSCRQGGSVHRSRSTANGLLGKLMCHFTPQPSLSSNLLAMSQVQNGICALDRFLNNKQSVNGVAKAGIHSHVKTAHTPTGMPQSNRYGQWGNLCPSAILPQGVFPCHVFRALHSQQREPPKHVGICTSGQRIFKGGAVPVRSSLDAWSKLSFGNIKLSRGQETVSSSSRNDSQRSQVLSSCGDRKTTAQPSSTVAAVNTCDSSTRPVDSNVTTSASSVEVATDTPLSTAQYHSKEKCVKIPKKMACVGKWSDSCDFSSNQPDIDQHQRESDVKGKLISRDCESSDDRIAQEMPTDLTCGAWCAIEPERDQSEQMKMDSLSENSKTNDSLYDSQNSDLSDVSSIDSKVGNKCVGAECLEILLERKFVLPESKDQSQVCVQSSSAETHQWNWEDIDSDSEEDHESADEGGCLTNEDNDELWNSLSNFTLSTLLSGKSTKPHSFSCQERGSSSLDNDLEEPFEHSTRPKPKHKPCKAVTKKWKEFYHSEPPADRSCKVQFCCGKGTDLVHEYEKMEGETYTVMELQKARDLDRMNSGKAASLLRSNANQDEDTGSGRGENLARKTSSDLGSAVTTDQETTNSDEDDDVVFSWEGDGEEHNGLSESDDSSCDEDEVECEIEDDDGLLSDDDVVFE